MDVGSGVTLSISPIETRKKWVKNGVGWLVVGCPCPEYFGVQ